MSRDLSQLKPEFGAAIDLMLAELTTTKGHVLRPFYTLRTSQEQARIVSTRSVETIRAAARLKPTARLWKPMLPLPRPVRRAA